MESEAVEPGMGVMDLVREVLRPGGRFSADVSQQSDEIPTYAPFETGYRRWGTFGRGVYDVSPPRRGSISAYGETDFGDSFASPGYRLNRMYETDLGTAAIEIVGNEKRTLDILETLSADIMLETARTSAARRRGSTFRLHEDMRRLFVPAHADLPPTLLILDPATPLNRTRRITGELAVLPDLLAGSLESTPRSDEEIVRELILSVPSRIITALNITRPEVILTCRPRMEKLSVPSPMQVVQTPTEQSTAGILCTDSSGELGVTAAYHGTGPAGTVVTVDGLSATVKIASETQDLVFIPLPAGLNITKKSGLKGILSRRTPSSYLRASFEGATSGARTTSVSSHDAGLLRLRSSLQLKVQTPADTDRGDSGAALIDEDGYILGFAFEKSAYGETPQITDWIWAANALNTLGLTPY